MDETNTKDRQRSSVMSWSEPTTEEVNKGVDNLLTAFGMEDTQENRTKLAAFINGTLKQGVSKKKPGRAYRRQHGTRNNQP